MISKQMLLYLNLYQNFMYWIIVASKDQVLFNHGLETHITCSKSMIRVSYDQCLTHFTSNITYANVMVYKRRFLLCITYVASGTLVYKMEPGSMVVHRPIKEVRDCLALFEMGCHEDGVYTIQPVSDSSIQTWCDMNNGGWTVIQSRMDGSEDFYRTWTDYVRGFGNRAGEYWIGLENIFGLTVHESSLKIEMEAFEDASPARADAKYRQFKVDNEASNFKLQVSGFSGSCGDSFLKHDGNMFTTKDRDNDRWKYNCAQKYKGGWWYKSCHHSNLNGLYLSGRHTSYADGINWYFCWGYHYSIRSSVMKVKRNVNSTTNRFDSNLNVPKYI